MKGLAAFYRLAGGPRRIFTSLWMIGFVGMQPVFFLLDSTPAPWDEWGKGNASPAVIAALWRETFTLPWALGLLVGIMTGELLTASFSWSLPSLRRRLVVGTTQVMFVVVVLTIVAHRGLSGTPAAAAGVAALAFSAGLILTNAAYSSRLRWGVAFMMLTAVVRPGFVIALASTSPWIVGIVTMTMGVSVVLRGLLPAVHREQALALFRQEGRSTRPWTLFGYRHRQDHRRPIGTNSTIEWLGAMGPVRLAGGAPQLLSAIILGAVAYTMNNVFLPFFLVALSVATGPTPGLAGPFVYPLSRRRRAMLSYLASAASAVARLGTAGLLAATLFALKPWPQFLASSDVPPPSIDLWARLALTFAWIPIAQWALSQPPIVDSVDRYTRANRWVPQTLASYTVFVGVVMLSAKLYAAQGGRVHLSVLAATVSLIAVLTQAIFYLLLQRSHARRDLV